MIAPSDQRILRLSRLPRLLVVDKENGGKSDALNAGIAVARAPLFCFDANSLLDSDALLRAVRPFMEEPEKTIGVGGTIRIANGSRVSAGPVPEVKLPRSFLALVQIIEYLRTFLTARLTLSRMQVLTVISGAFGLSKRQLALEVGGYSHGTVCRHGACGETASPKLCSIFSRLTARLALGAQRGVSATPAGSENATPTTRRR